MCKNIILIKLAKKERKKVSLECVGLLPSWVIRAEKRVEPLLSNKMILSANTLTALSEVALDSSLPRHSTALLTLAGFE